MWLKGHWVARGLNDLAPWSFWVISGYAALIVALLGALAYRLLTRRPVEKPPMWWRGRRSVRCRTCKKIAAWIEQERLNKELVVVCKHCRATFPLNPSSRNAP